MTPGVCNQSSPTLPGGKQEPETQSTTLARAFGARSPAEEYLRTLKVL